MGGDIFRAKRNEALDSFKRPKHWPKVFKVLAFKEGELYNLEHSLANKAGWLRNKSLNLEVLVETTIGVVTVYIKLVSGKEPGTFELCADTVDMQGPTVNSFSGSLKEYPRVQANSINFLTITNDVNFDDGTVILPTLDPLHVRFSLYPGGKVTMTVEAGAQKVRVALVER
jgi:hypothetical protein